jgi:O-antigen/teichoic acid export membrane protein
VFSLASFASISVITLATSILSARLYGITVIGQLALVMVPISIVTLLSTVREQPAMVRELAKLEPRDPRATGIFLAVFSFSFVLTSIVAMLGVVACYFAFYGPLHNPKLFVPAVVGLLGYLIIINTCWNFDGVFGAFRAGRELFAVRLDQAVVNGVLIVAFLPVAHNVWGLLMAFLGSWLSALAHRLLLLRRVIRWRVPWAEIQAGMTTLREIVTFGLKLTPGWIAWGLSDVSGTWILGVTSTVNAVGAYSRAWNLASRFNDLNWRITEMLLPTLVQRRASGDTNGFNRALVDSLRYTSFGMLLPAAVGGGAAGAVMHIFGSGFDSAIAALRWLLFVPLLQSLIAIQGTALMASNRPMLTAAVQVLRLVVTVVAGVILTQALGMTGMAIAMVAGVLVSFGVNLVIFRLVQRIPLLALWSVRQTAGLGAAYACGFWISNVAEHRLPGVLGLAVALIFGSAAYIVVGIGVGGMTSRDRTRFRSVVERITGRGPVVAKGTGAA